MMYSEFVAGTGCKQTEFNYNVFLKLEEIYTNSDLTKEEIYTIGKMRVDNSETEREREGRLLLEKAIEEIEARCAELRDLIALEKEKIEWRKDMAETFPEETFWKNCLRNDRKYIASLRTELRNEQLKMRLLRS